MIGSEVLGEAGFLLLLDFGFDRQSSREPGAHAGDDLADSGLRDAVFLGDLASGTVVDEAGAMDVEIAGSGGKGGGGHGGLLGEEDFGFPILDLGLRCRGRETATQRRWIWDFGKPRKLPGV